MKTVLVIAAHPDDEVLGCGGTIAKHVSQGDKVHLLFMADGVKSRLNFSEKNLNSRIESAKSAQSLLGVISAVSLDLPDNQMDSVPILKIVQKIEPIIESLKPSIIYTHHYGDLNIDHKLTNAAVMTACRPLPNSSIREIYGFEILSSTELSMSKNSSFVPTYFVDITNQISIKLNAVSAYHEEMRDVPHSRSVKHVEILAKHRGYSIGVSMAEAFEVYRIIG